MLRYDMIRYNTVLHIYVCWKKTEKFTKICDSPPWTPMNRRAKFDAAYFILGG